MRAHIRREPVAALGNKCDHAGALRFQVVQDVTRNAARRFICDTRACNVASARESVRDESDAAMSNSAWLKPCILDVPHDVRDCGTAVDIGCRALRDAGKVTARFERATAGNVDASGYAYSASGLARRKSVRWCPACARRGYATPARRGLRSRYRSRCRSDHGTCARFAARRRCCESDRDTCRRSPRSVRPLDPDRRR